MKLTGAQALIKSLELEGVEVMFGLPGGCILPAYDPLIESSIRHVLPMGATERNRIFNLGYFTWVEQRGVSLADFEARRDQAFWRGLHSLLPAWDGLIAEFNHSSGAA